MVAFHIYRDALGKWRWYLRDADHRKIATSGGSYAEKSACLEALKQVLGLDGETPIYED
jgi:uncharacterized protein YegP (UPF0339 family)